MEQSTEAGEVTLVGSGDVKFPAGGSGGQSPSVDRSIVVVATMPDDRGLEEITNPKLRATVAEAIERGQDPVALQDLAEILDMYYPKAAKKVQRRALSLAAEKHVTLEKSQFLPDLLDHEGR